MISDEYKMPKFEKNRYLTKPFGIKNTGDWSQDGQSLIIDQVIIFRISSVITYHCDYQNKVLIDNFYLRFSFEIQFYDMKTEFPV